MAWSECREEELRVTIAGKAGAPHAARPSAVRLPGGEEHEEVRETKVHFIGKR
jgi:hypothetical protein